MWLFLLLAAALLTPLPGAQGPRLTPSQAEASHEFFSGTVANLAEGSIVVARTVLGKPAENRTFRITGETIVEGSLKVGVRVTVGFRSTPEGDLAVRIIVREQKKDPKN